MQRFCRCKDDRILQEISDIGEFCEGIHITDCRFQVIGRAPIRRNSENARNNTGQAAPIRDRNITTRDLSRITEQGVSANVPVEIGGALDVRNEAHTFERNRDYVLPAGVMQTQEEHYMDIVEYHVTLVAQADKTILLAGRGGLRGAAARVAAIAGSTT